ncbi:uncharacterized protein LOC123024023 [Varanus komodoensis]|uniref:uncharacterized protein LOC123024023 n=1 Tax=Varanus komodoensis TaxID=61221 RepID=UPI001CF7CE72|nr:uncharacterized protein LOC123024023 [Varanus komodoensis]
MGGGGPNPEGPPVSPLPVARPAPPFPGQPRRHSLSVAPERAPSSLAGLCFGLFVLGPSFFLFNSGRTEKRERKERQLAQARKGAGGQAGRNTRLAASGSGTLRSPSFDRECARLCAHRVRRADQKEGKTRRLGELRRDWTEGDVRLLRLARTRFERPFQPFPQAPAGDTPKTWRSLETREKKPGRREGGDAIPALDRAQQLASRAVESRKPERRCGRPTEPTVRLSFSHQEQENRELQDGCRRA